MSAFDNIKDKGQDLVDNHGEQVDQGIDKAGDLVDQHTGGGHSGQIDQGEDKLRDGLDKLDGQDDDLR
jgi:hypothetical protein